VYRYSGDSTLSGCLQKKNEVAPSQFEPPHLAVSLSAPRAPALAAACLRRGARCGGGARLAAPPGRQPPV
jgi:hypothetical protein